MNYESIPRLLIWSRASEFILEKPFFGWGAAVFPIIYFLKEGEWKGHAHNLFLDLSISYGLIVSICIFGFIGFNALNSSRYIYTKKIGSKNIDRAFLTSTLIFLILHLFDVMYFDLRISIIVWILLSGLKAIVNEKEEVNFSI